jgi:hypothetical protein
LFKNLDRRGYKFCGGFFYFGEGNNSSFFPILQIFSVQQSRALQFTSFFANLIATHFLTYSFHKSTFSSAVTMLLLALFYARSNSGFNIISWGGIHSAPSLFKISSPCKNANVSYGDLLFSFFL